MRQAAEPSVEEILDSIKQVIARDAAAPAVEDRRRRAAAPVAPPPGASCASSTRCDEDDAVLDLAEADRLDGEPAGDDADADTDTDADADTGPLLAANAVSAMRESLVALATMAAPGVAPQIVRAGETSLEGLVRELLRPQLAEWLDKNLPPLVERLVAAEIARIVGKKV